MRTVLKGHSMKAEPLLAEGEIKLTSTGCSLSSIHHTHKLSITFFFERKEKTLFYQEI